MTEPTPPPPKRTLSPAEIEQRRNASLVARQHATGPRTEDGKAASSRNAWKHGQYSAINRAQFGLGAASVAKLFGKPCVTTCPYHPDNAERQEHPCTLVLDGLTHAGASCLDRTVFVHALQSLMDVMQTGNMDGMQGLLATEMASNLQLLHHIRQEVSERGAVYEIPFVAKDGTPVIDPQTNRPYVAEMRANPVLAHLIKLTESMGINFGELMATPRAREKLADENNAAGAMQAAFGAIFQRAANHLPKPKPKVIDGDA